MSRQQDWACLPRISLLQGSDWVRGYYTSSGCERRRGKLRSPGLRRAVCHAVNDGHAANVPTSDVNDLPNRGRDHGPNKFSRKLEEYSQPSPQHDPHLGTIGPEQA